MRMNDRILDLMSLLHNYRNVFARYCKTPMIRYATNFYSLHLMIEMYNPKTAFGATWYHIAPFCEETVLACKHVGDRIYGTDYSLNLCLDCGFIFEIRKEKQREKRWLEFDDAFFDDLEFPHKKSDKGHTQTETEPIMSDQGNVIHDQPTNGHDPACSKNPNAFNSSLKTTENDSKTELDGDVVQKTQDRSQIQSEPNTVKSMTDDLISKQRLDAVPPNKSRSSIANIETMNIVMTSFGVPKDKQLAAEKLYCALEPIKKESGGWPSYAALAYFCIWWQYEKNEETVDEASLKQYLKNSFGAKRKIVPGYIKSWAAKKLKECGENLQ